jgi:hypothetical protein
LIKDLQIQDGGVIHRLFYWRVFKVITFNAVGVHKTLKMPLKRALNIQMIKYSSKVFKRL